MRFSENLQYLRKRNDLTQEQLAEKLEISRQAVSKWESDQSYPEMDKLLQLADLFECNLDVLIKGDATVGDKQDLAGYNHHMDRLGAIAAGAVALIICSVAVTVFLENLVPEGLVTIIMFAMIAMGVFALIVSGIDHDYFIKRYPEIQDFYKEEEKRNFHRRFAIAIASAVCLIFFAICLNIALEYVGKGAWESVSGGLFLLLIAAAVAIFIYYGVQEDKYNIEKYNLKNTGNISHGEAQAGKICGCIMLLATAIFLYFGLVRDQFGSAWVVFPIGGLLCGVASIIWADKK